MANLLVDEGIGQHLVQQVRAQSLAVFHALEFLPKGSEDSLVFLEAQQRQLTIVTWNHDDFTLLAHAWQQWGLGDHFGVITRPARVSQLLPAQLLTVLEQFARDSRSFVNSITTF